MSNHYKKLREAKMSQNEAKSKQILVASDSAPKLQLEDSNGLQCNEINSPPAVIADQ